MYSSVSSYNIQYCSKMYFTKIGLTDLKFDYHIGFIYPIIYFSDFAWPHFRLLNIYYGNGPIYDQSTYGDI